MEKVKGALGKYAASVLGAGLAAYNLIQAQESLDYEMMLVQVATQS